METNQMSDVERFFYAIQKHFNVDQNRKWSDLNPMEQHQFIQGINFVLAVMQ